MNLEQKEIQQVYFKSVKYSSKREIFFLEECCIDDKINKLCRKSLLKVIKEKIIDVLRTFGLLNVLRKIKINIRL